MFLHRHRGGSGSIARTPRLMRAITYVVLGLLHLGFTGGFLLSVVALPLVVEKLMGALICLGGSLAMFMVGLIVRSEYRIENERASGVGRAA